MPRAPERHILTPTYPTGSSKQDQRKRELLAQGISPLQAVQLMTCCGKVSRGAADNTFTTAGQLCQPLGGRATPLGGKGKEDQGQRQED